MPEEVEECVSSVLEDNPDYSESKAYAICNAQMKGYDDPEAVAAVALKQESGDWPGIHPAEKTSKGREHLLDRHAEKARELTKEARQNEEVSIKFKANLGGPSAIFKVSDDGDERFVIWGKASVEVVDKEGDKITAEALKNALPQLLRRERLSVEHTDQLVGDIKDKFETDEPTTVEIDGREYTRKEFPTDVLKLEEDEPPALFVAGEIWDDSRQAQEVRKDIEDGVIDSYSISGEAISSSTKIKDGEVYDEISELDLSAVTLCEEGMNSEAKFGTVVKMGDDSVSPRAGGTSSPQVAVLKSTTEDAMNDTTGSESEDGEAFKREELRGEFKDAAKEALADSDFVTADEVKSIVDERVSAAKENDEDDEEDVPSNASDAASDEAEEQDPDEKADDDDPDDSENEVDLDGEEDTEDEDDEEEKALDDPEVQDAVAALVNAYENLSREEVEDALSGLVEGADQDEQVVPEDEDKEDDIGVPEGPDVEEPESAESDVVAQLEDEGVPDDLIEAVSEYLGAAEEEVPTDEESPGDEEVVEASEGHESGETEKEEEPIGGEDLGGDVSKTETDAEYLAVTAGGAVPSTEEDEDLRKSFNREDGGDVEDEPSTLDHFYQSVGEET